MLIIMNGHITPTPTYPVASTFSLLELEKIQTLPLLTEIQPNSSKTWSACQSYFNYGTYGEYLMNPTARDWSRWSNSHSDQNAWRQLQIKGTDTITDVFISNFLNLCCHADVDLVCFLVRSYPWTLVVTKSAHEKVVHFLGTRAEGFGVWLPVRGFFMFSPCPSAPAPSAAFCCPSECLCSFVPPSQPADEFASNSTSHLSVLGLWWYPLLSLPLRVINAVFPPPPGADVGDGKEYCHISPPPPRQMEGWDSKAIVAALLGHLIVLSVKVTLKHLFLHRTTSGALTAALL